MTRAEFTPRPYQTQMLAHMLDVPRCALWAGMGMGKSCATLNALHALELTEPGPALVLAPLRVARSTWPDEVAKWEHLRGFSVVPVVGTPAERKAALRQEANVYTTNYDQLGWLVEHFGDKWPFTKIVADESTRLKGFRLGKHTRKDKDTGKKVETVKRSTYLARVAHTKASRFIELTGTPSPNGLQDLWGQAWFLDKGQRLGASFSAFEKRWFQSISKGAHAAARELLPLPFAQDQIQERLRDVALTLDPADWFDLREPIVNVVRVTLPAKARQQYQDMQREMFAQIGEHEVEALNAAAKSAKCLQMASGSVWVDSEAGTWAETHDLKLQALESIAQEAAGAPQLVRYHWVPSRERILRAFPKARMLDDDPQTIRDWNAGRIPMLVAHAQSAGHGLNLQDGGHHYVAFDHWWDLEHHQQITERIGPVRQAQAGHNRPVHHHYITATGTVDDLVMARPETKRSVQDLLLEAMKRRDA